MNSAATRAYEINADRRVDGSGEAGYNRAMDEPVPDLRSLVTRFREIEEDASGLTFGFYPRKVGGSRATILPAI